MGFERWATIFGSWALSDDQALYVGGSPHSGLILSPHTLSDGQVEVTFAVGAEPNVDAPETESVSGARIVFGYDIRQFNSYSAGLGHQLVQYVVERFTGGTEGWNPIGFAGAPAVLVPSREYHLQLQILGQRAFLRVDDVPVLDIQLPVAPSANQLGLMAWGRYPVWFSNFDITASAPRLFVVMQFGAPFDGIYSEVIAPVAEAAGFQARRADEMPGPGQILEDITREIREATVVVAEISEANPNVYYEVGYAHAVGTPTVLLARRGQPLPFDVSGFRCIFYDDTISGKHHVEEELTRHLRALAARTELSF